VLLNNVRIWVSRFASTYCCEQAFSIMKISKSRLRTRVTDGHLDAAMCIATVFHREAKFFNIGPMRTCPTQRFFSRTTFVCMFWEM